MYTVYPRVCGGTLPDADGWTEVTGLSPRVRGHLCACERQPFQHRSIPACAGAPVRRHPAEVKTAVYPRVCGVTSPTNPTATSWSRSIPACAGSP